MTSLNVRLTRLNDPGCGGSGGGGGCDLRLDFLNNRESLAKATCGGKANNRDGSELRARARARE